MAPVHLTASITDFRGRRHGRERGAVMFTELTEELLDLEATVRGSGSALYALNDDPGCSSGCSCALCIILCCHLCW
jgi:hypothetical protein